MKYLKLLFVPAMMLAMASCGGDDDSSSTNLSTPDEGTDVVSNALTPDEQKNILEQTARELLSKVNADDFQSIADIAEYVSENMSGGSKTDALDDWLDAAMQLTDGNYSAGVQKRLWLASNFTGAFEYSGRRWVQTREGGSNLQFTFPDKSGTTCVAVIEASGTVYQVHHEEFDDYDYDYSYYTGYTETRYENTIGVPKHVTASLTQGGTTLASATVNTSISTSGDVRLSRDVAEVTVDATVAGYTIRVNKARYSGGSDAQVEAVLSKNGETLVSVSAKADISLSDNGEVRSAGSGQIVADVLGKVKVNGQCSDIDKLSGHLEDIEGRYNNEQTVKNAVAGINSVLNAGVYYNGGSDRMAYLQYEAVRTDRYGDYWTADPVICFRDGSAYSYMDEFFDDRTFSTVKKRFENLVRDFEDMFDY